MRPVRGMGFVPGVARGRITRVPREKGILIADHAVLRGLADWPAGCIAHNAAPFAHATIGLLSNAVPTVIVNTQQLAGLDHAAEVVIDGASGWIFPAGGPEAHLTALPPPASRPLQSADGCVIELRASVRCAAGVRAAREQGASAVGLVRTEFLLPPGGRAPDAAYYAAAFAELCAAAGDVPVTFRLVDLAADKHPAWAASVPCSSTLGLQGARLYHHPAVRAVMQAQLDAIATLRASASCRVLLPYVTSVEEFVHWRAVIESVLPPGLVEIGAMLENPAAAMLVDELLQAADFVGIGANDLMQCFFGADRDEPAVGRYLDAYSPALYRFLRVVAEQAGANIGRIQLCGVLSQLQGTLPVLLGLGYRVFAVDPVHLPYLGQRVATTSFSESQALAQAVCAADSAREVAGLLAMGSGSTD